MKRILLTIVCIYLAALANAQIAKWLIEPMYDDIHMAAGIDAIITDSANTKTLWSYDGKRLATTTNEIFEFRENLSVSTVPGTANIACVFKSNGESIKIANCNVAHAYPYYSCGKLLVQEGMYYRFVSVDGSINGGKYTKAYPYFNGYASCQTFLNMEKQKDPYLLLVNKNEEMVQFSYNGKNFGTDDVEFISSVNDENLAIVVIKHKLYKFNGTDGSLSPVFASEDETNLKNQAKIDGDLNQCYSKVDENTSVLTAKCGKSGEVSFEFDNMLKPVSFAANGDLKKYSAKKEEKKEFTSPLRMDTKGNLYGIYWDSEEMLPAQFDKLSTCFDNKAFVQLKGKYGMLAIDKDAKFSLKINKGNDVAFLHQKFETVVRVDMPTYILSDKTYLEIDPSTGIELDKTSREKKNTESGNFVEYNCVLNIPENLPDEIEEISYPIQVVYNGLKSPVINHKINAWFYKKFEVEEDESQRHVDHGTLTFVFNIKNAQLDGAIVKFDVSVLADTLSVQREDKMSETRYKYKVEGLNEGTNNIVVQILEQGCPPASFPFEVEYHKPVPKTKKAPAEQEKVVIKKKAKMQQQPKKQTSTSPTPRLEL